MALLLSVGQVFARDFRIVQPLSQGGMGAVYVVEQLSTGSHRALKLMHPQLVQDPKLRQRFEQEARIGARIQSDHVVQVIAAGIDAETGAPFLVMELLRGEDLAAALSRRGAFSVHETLEIAGQLFHAIAAAHAVGVVHRDLKPNNIFLAAANREGAAFTVKVLDFGIAKVVAEAQTHQTAAVGTPLWMAPEQTSPNSAVGPQADVWALGLVVFNLLTGCPYWLSANSQELNTAALLREILVENIVPASQRASQYNVSSRLPPGFDDWFAACVSRSPEARFGDAGAARNALHAVLSRAAAGSPPPPQSGQFSGPAPQQPATFNAPRTVLVPPAVSVSLGSPMVHSQSSPRISQSQTVQKSKGPLVAGALAGLVVIGAGVLIVTKLRSSNDQRTCDKMVTSSEEAKDPAEACRRACKETPSSCVTRAELVLRYKIGDKPVDDARGYYKRGCDAGDQRGCRGYASTLERTEPTKAVDLYKTACDKGDGDACTLLGVLYEEGRGVTRDAGRALQLYDQACKSSDRLGCAYQAFILSQGLGVRQDEARATELGKEAATWLGMECDASHPKQCVALGGMLASGMGGAKEDSKALELMQKACDANEPAGCANAGVMKVFGVGGPKDAKAALADLTKACDEGEWVACTSLGVLKAHAVFVVRRGVRGVATLKLACNGVYKVGCAAWGPAYPPSADIPQDLAAAAALSTKACDHGELTACVNLGGFTHYGSGTTKNREKAAELFKKACDGGSGDGCGELADMYASGRGFSADPKRANELLQRSCDFGEKDSCVLSALNKINGEGVARAPEEGVAAVKGYCEKSHIAMACNSYGSCLMRGIGVPKDPAAGVNLWKQACETKLERIYPASCVNLGSLYELGTLGQKDPVAAAKLYQTACDQGDLSGCAGTARFLADGTAGQKDPMRAMGILDAGCKAGDASSCDLLGVFYATGRGGLPANGAKGLEYMQMACDDSNWVSCSNIGQVHAEGIGGLPKNREAAQRYFKLACDHNYEDACKRLKAL